MVTAQPRLAIPTRRQQVAVVAALLAVAAVGWAVFLAEASDDTMPMSMGEDGPAATEQDMGPMAGMEAADGADPMAGMDRPGMRRTDPLAGADIGEARRSGATVPDLTMGGDALPFVASWTAMMAAMMLPAASPMVLLYARTQPGRPLNVGLFTGAYLALWATFGVAAFAVALAVEELAQRFDVVAGNWGRAAGVLIVVAGLYQFSRLKDVCLRRCRSPLAFVLRWWREGRAGAVQMGLRHGLYCAGCCWLLFIVLVPIGLMDVLAMLLVAAAVFAEKVLPRPKLTRNLVAAALIAYGVAVIARPSLLPTLA